jgi:phosphoribosylpyrophosphate synthetase
LYVTDTVAVAEKDWGRLHVVSIAPLIAGALERFMADRSIGDPY